MQTHIINTLLVLVYVQQHITHFPAALPGANTCCSVFTCCCVEQNAFVKVLGGARRVGHGRGVHTQPAAGDSVGQEHTRFYSVNGTEHV